jgi:hypothetical protein
MPKRPTLATAICIYEVVMIVFGLYLRRWSHAFILAHPERGYPPTPLWLTVVYGLDDLIAVAAIVMLWRMKRPASYLFTTRFFVFLLLFIHAKIWPSVPLHPAKIKHLGFVHFVENGVGIFFLLLSGSIATYVYMILFHPRPPSMNTEPTSKWPAPPPIR